ncbi:MAG: hypothetical protein HYT62_03945 [Candidatus Yanofskybacteria bacterium]|nr:hypothetical protein [Candidatus Yanofskybacteria bacterium]
MDEVLKYFSLLMGNIGGFSSLSGVSGMGFTWLFGALGAVSLSLYGLSLGRTRAVMSLLAIYVTFAFDRLFPYFSEIKNMVSGSVVDYWIRIGIFLAVYILVFIIFNFSLLRKRFSSSEFSLFGILLISLLQLGFVGSIIFSYLPNELAVKWSFGFYNYIGTQQALFFWAMAPLPALLLLRSK